MKVLFGSAEAAPFFKSGGLGDVAAALPKKLVKQGVDIRVVLPNYTKMPDKYKSELKEHSHFRFQLGNKNVYCGIKTLKHDNVMYYFIDNLSYFDRPDLYGEWDDGERFAYFSTAIIVMLEVVDFISYNIQCDDYETAMILAMLVDRYHWKNALKTIFKVITIHINLLQDIYDPTMLTHVFGTSF